MYAVASMDLGSEASLPIVAQIGRDWAWVAVPVWLVVFAAMCLALVRAVLRQTRLRQTRQRRLAPEGRL